DMREVLEAAKKKFEDLTEEDKKLLRDTFKTFEVVDGEERAVEIEPTPENLGPMRGAAYAAQFMAMGDIYGQGTYGHGENYLLSISNLREEFSTDKETLDDLVDKGVPLEKALQTEHDTLKGLVAPSVIEQIGGKSHGFFKFLLNEIPDVPPSGRLKKLDYLRGYIDPVLLENALINRKAIEAITEFNKRLNIEGEKQRLSPEDVERLTVVAIAEITRRSSFKPGFQNPELVPDSQDALALNVNDVVDYLFSYYETEILNIPEEDVNAMSHIVRRLMAMEEGLPETKVPLETTINHIKEITETTEPARGEQANAYLNVEYPGTKPEFEGETVVIKETSSRYWLPKDAEGNVLPDEMITQEQKERAQQQSIDSLTRESRIARQVTYQLYDPSVRPDIPVPEKGGIPRWLDFMDMRDVNGKAYMVIEQIPGATPLLDYLTAGNKVTPEAFESLKLTIQRLHALGYAHTDMHLDNIVVDQDGNLWLIDLGLAMGIENFIEEGMTIEEIKEAEERFWQTAKEQDLKGPIEQPQENNLLRVEEVITMLNAWTERPVTMTDMEKKLQQNKDSSIVKALEEFADSRRTLASILLSSSENKDLKDEALSLGNTLFSFRNRPADATGGDISYTHRISDNEVLIIHGDATDHGFNGAVSKAIINRLLPEILRETNDPAQILQRLTDELSQISREITARTPFIWGALSVTRLDTETGEGTVATAGQDVAIINFEQEEYELSRVSDKIESEYRAGLGAIRKARYKEIPIKLNENEFLASVSDGVWEQKDSQGIRYGRETLEGRLLDMAEAEKTPSEIQKGIINDALRDVLDNKVEQEDDASVVVAGRKPASTRILASVPNVILDSTDTLVEQIQQFYDEKVNTIRSALVELNVGMPDKNAERIARMDKLCNQCPVDSSAARARRIKLIKEAADNYNIKLTADQIKFLVTALSTKSTQYIEDAVSIIGHITADGFVEESITNDEVKQLEFLQSLIDSYKKTGDTRFLKTAEQLESISGRLLQKIRTQSRLAENIYEPEALRKYEAEEPGFLRRLLNRITFRWRYKDKIIENPVAEISRDVKDALRSNFYEYLKKTDEQLKQLEDKAQRKKRKKQLRAEASLVADEIAKFNLQNLRDQLGGRTVRNIEFDPYNEQIAVVTEDSVIQMDAILPKDIAAENMLTHLRNIGISESEIKSINRDLKTLNRRTLNQKLAHLNKAVFFIENIWRSLEVLQTETNAKERRQIIDSVEKDFTDLQRTLKRMPLLRRVLGDHLRNTGISFTTIGELSETAPEPAIVVSATTTSNVQEIHKKTKDRTADAQADLIQARTNLARSAAKTVAENAQDLCSACPADKKETINNIYLPVFDTYFATEIKDPAERPSRQQMFALAEALYGLHTTNYWIPVEIVAKSIQDRKITPDEVEPLKFALKKINEYIEKGGEFADEAGYFETVISNLLVRAGETLPPVRPAVEPMSPAELLESDIRMLEDEIAQKRIELADSYLVKSMKNIDIYQGVPRVVPLPDIHGGFIQMLKGLEMEGVIKIDEQTQALLDRMSVIEEQYKRHKRTATSRPELYDFKADEYFDILQEIDLRKIFIAEPGTHITAVGDYMDRGIYNTQVIDFLKELEIVAKEKGSKVIPLMGNHDIGILVFMDQAIKQGWSYDRVIREAKEEDFKGYSFISTLRSFETKYGKDWKRIAAGFNKDYRPWLENLKKGAKINNFYFTHGGLHFEAESLEDLNAKYDEFVADAKQDPAMLIYRISGPNQIMGYAEDWYNNDRVESTLQKMGVDFVVVGHQKGKGHPARYNRFVVVIDAGISPGYFGFAAGIEIDQKKGIGMKAQHELKGKVELLMPDEQATQIVDVVPTEATERAKSEIAGLEQQIEEKKKELQELEAPPAPIVQPVTHEQWRAGKRPVGYVGTSESVREATELGIDIVETIGIREYTELRALTDKIRTPGSSLTQDEATRVAELSRLAVEKLQDAIDEEMLAVPPGPPVAADVFSRASFILNELKAEGKPIIMGNVYEKLTNYNPKEQGEIDSNILYGDKSLTKFAEDNRMGDLINIVPGALMWFALGESKNVPAEKGLWRTYFNPKIENREFVFKELALK
ncbi:SpoIIE family protein phosphatase, partial [Candidatus Woesearchaeota archaeon]|nr:SpoIIE family protein phosphatase [Candidatus Woesearchaeota archaeon]